MDFICIDWVRHLVICKVGIYNLFSWVDQLFGSFGYFLKGYMSLRNKVSRILCNTVYLAHSSLVWHQVCSRLNNHKVDKFLRKIKFTEYYSTNITEYYSVA
jgi:hypothetical protein